MSCRRRTTRLLLSRSFTTGYDAPPPAAPTPATANPNPRSAEPLPPLNRPLGVKQRPTTVERTRTDRLKDLLDHDALMAQRRHLVKQACKGYYHDMNMTRRHGGKTWIAPKVLIKEERALFLPNLHGQSLGSDPSSSSSSSGDDDDDGGKRKDTTTLLAGKISILAMLGTQISVTHAQSFARATQVRYAAHPLFRYVQINLQENILKAFLVKIFSNSLRSVVPREQHHNYLISNQNLEYVRDPMGMTNSKVGYVYLVDENLKIRWAGCADATEEEAQALERCTGVLIKRLEAKSLKK